MKLIADLHLHSKYSRAVSPQMVLPEIARAAEEKGIGLVGTGDWTHPLWLRELEKGLEEVESGAFQIKNEKVKIKNGERENERNKKDEGEGVRFILSTEISSIYTQGGKGRRIHNLIFAPSFATVRKINEALIKKGANLISDGRPIIGLSSRDLASLVMETDENCLVVPAHVWTPWFSLYGSISGFDSLEECFGDMSKFIYGIETGLSSDPQMNWQIKDLENRSILSFSDAHSARKLGREATVFETRNPKSETRNEEFAYQDIVGAIKQKESSKFQIVHTIEFYPEEGKYHWTGHRNCKIKRSPEETKTLGTTCPVCGRRLTVGVADRVEEISNIKYQISNIKTETDKNGVRWISTDGRPGFARMVPLLEIITEALETTETSQKAINEHDNLIKAFGSEFGILLEAPLEELIFTASERVAEGIKKVREGKIFVDPGFDGEFGKVKIWEEENAEKENKQEQIALF